MASPIIYSYEPNTVVWIITTDGDGCSSSVKEGIVIQVRINAQITETIIRYDIRLGTDTGVTEFIESDIFATLTAAVDEYEVRLT